MTGTYRTADCLTYRMDYRSPHRVLEPLEAEAAAVQGALQHLHEAGVLPHTRYDEAGLLALRRAVEQHFEVPWTAITPRMQRLLYAINAVTRPRNLIAAGIFCGFTFIANAGAAIGPGACYEAEQLVGVEIVLAEAHRAERNVRRLCPLGGREGDRVARIIADDAVKVLAQFAGPIHLLYLDADGAGGRGKGIYLDILEAAYPKLPPGAVVLAHNSFNAAERLKHYLAFVRDPAHFRASLNVVFDPEGLEVSAR